MSLSANATKSIKQVQCCFISIQATELKKLTTCQTLRHCRRKLTEKENKLRPPCHPRPSLLLAVQQPQCNSRLLRSKYPMRVSRQHFNLVQPWSPQRTLRYMPLRSQLSPQSQHRRLHQLCPLNPWALPERQSQGHLLPLQTHPPPWWSQLHPLRP